MMRRLFLFLLVGYFFSLYGEEAERIVPRGLEKGDCIALVLPASRLPKEWIERIVSSLEEEGFVVQLARNSEMSHGHFCGDDAARLDALMECWLDPSVKAVWCLSGGYGCSRVVSKLDVELLCRHPKILIGMSDITALHSALNNAGLVTFLGPVAFQLFALEENKEERIASKEHLFALLDPKYIDAHRCYDLAEDEKIQVLRGGEGRGELVGGNLSLIAAHIGTPWQLDTKGKILVLEDVGEPTYRIDRMLWQLKEAGLLNDLAGAILCSWTGCHPKSDTYRGEDVDLKTVVESWFKDAPYPVLSGFPAGHIAMQYTLPLGCMAKLDTTHKTLELLGDWVR